ncbi:MAG: phospholipase D-like domain-containing protein [Actinomycetota bacterium]
MPTAPRLSVRRVLAWTGLTVITVQVGAALALMAADALRKRRFPPSGRFPRMSPEQVEAHGSRLTVYTDGDELYEAMLADIRGARETILFETYIWKGDEVGKLFKAELTAAADRGVAVYVIYDTFANLVVPRSFKEFDDRLQVLPFGLVNGRFPLSPRTYARDHRKLLVVDERVGYVGGYNVGKLYSDTWRDTHLRIEGPAAWELSNAFVDFWNYYKKDRHPGLPDRGARKWDARIRASLNLPNRLLFPVRGMYIDAIERSVESVDITQGYFLPDEEVIDALLRAVNRGVEVRVLVPEFSNHVVADWVARGLLSRLLAGGVRIFLFEHAMVHAKTATVDGRWTTIGTTNIDRLSMFGNFEINIEVYDDELARRMGEVFASDLGNARELTREEWEARPAYKRVVEQVLRPVAPLL